MTLLHLNLYHCLENDKNETQHFRATHAFVTSLQYELNCDMSCCIASALFNGAFKVADQEGLWLKLHAGAIWALGFGQRLTSIADKSPMFHTLEERTRQRYSSVRGCMSFVCLQKSCSSTNPLLLEVATGVAHAGKQSFDMEDIPLDHPVIGLLMQILGSPGDIPGPKET